MPREIIHRDVGLPAGDDVENTDSFRQFGCDMPESIDFVDDDEDVRGLFRPGFKFRHDLDGEDDLEGYGWGDPTVLRTPDVKPRDRLFLREMDHRDIFIPINDDSGRREEIEIWGFTDYFGSDELEFPNPTMRAVQGELIHSYHRPSHGPHTIHHHGIGASPINDGVGHITFELEGDGYIYQFRAKDPGTYIYHCHRNTVLHFELGMYGLLIIDPPAPPGSNLTAPYADGGPGYVMRRSDPVRYDVEGLWVLDDFDLRWHDDRADDGVLNHGHGAGIECPFEPWHPDPEENPHLHRFEPNRFLITGVIADQRDPLITHPKVAVDARVGDTVLLRVVNASYTRTKITLPSALNAEVISMDGKVLGGEGHTSYAYPFSLSEMRDSFELTTAQRWDLLLHDAPAGTWEVEVEYRHWISGKVLGVARTLVTVT